MTADYDARCAAAQRAQGLDPVMAALDERGLPAVYARTHLLVDV
jgi:hypothetical protein